MQISSVSHEPDAQGQSFVRGRVASSMGSAIENSIQLPARTTAISLASPVR